MSKSMVKGVVLLLFLSFSSNLAAADCARSKMEGKIEASQNHQSLGWMVGGAASGFLLGLVGTGIFTAIAAIPSPGTANIPPARIDAGCFDKGYSGKARVKNVLSALGGGAFGTAVAVVVLSFMASNQ